MKTGRYTAILLVVAMLFTMPPAVAEDAPAMYFVPDVATVMVGEETTIDLMINTSTQEMGAQVTLRENPAYFEIINVSLEGCAYPPVSGVGWDHAGDFVTIAGMADSPGVDGVNKFASITVIGRAAGESDIEMASAEPVGVVMYPGTVVVEDASPAFSAIIQIGDGRGEVTLPIEVRDAVGMGSCDVTLTYNSAVVNVVSVANGDVDNMVSHISDNSVRIGAFQSGVGMMDNFVLATVDLVPATTSGVSPLDITVTTYKDDTPDCAPMDYVVYSGTYEVVLGGDVNGDDVLDMADAMYIAKHVVGVPGFESIDAEMADVNGDGIVDMSDAMYLAKHVLGIPGFETLG